MNKWFLLVWSFQWIMDPVQNWFKSYFTFSWVSPIYLLMYILYIFEHLTGHFKNIHFILNAEGTKYSAQYCMNILNGAFESFSNSESSCSHFVVISLKKMTSTFIKKSAFVFNRRKSVILVWNNIKNKMTETNSEKQLINSTNAIYSVKTLEQLPICTQSCLWRSASLHGLFSNPACDCQWIWRLGFSDTRVFD